MASSRATRSPWYGPKCAPDGITSPSLNTPRSASGIPDFLISRPGGRVRLARSVTPMGTGVSWMKKAGPWTSHSVMKKDLQSSQSGRERCNEGKKLCAHRLLIYYKYFFLSFLWYAITWNVQWSHVNNRSPPCWSWCHILLEWDRTRVKFPVISKHPRVPMSQVPMRGRRL